MADGDAFDFSSLLQAGMQPDTAPLAGLGAADSGIPFYNQPWTPSAATPAFNLASETGGGAFGTPGVDVGGYTGVSRAPAQPPGFWSRLGTGVEQSFEKDPIGAFSKTAGLGVGALGIANQLRTAGQIQQANQASQQALKQATSAAAPAVSLGTDLTKATQAGEVTPAMQASIDRWKTQAKADMKAKLEHLKMGDATTMEQYMADIDAKGEEIKAQMIESQGRLGLAALQTGVSAATGGGQLANQQMAALNSLIAQANQQLGLMAGRMG